jgi:biofilm PGA synthesis N-glycosyltransferase PgaC
MMYLLTISVIGLPFFLEERSIVSVSFLHYIIIGFACIMLTKYTVFMLLGPWHDVKQRIQNHKQPKDIHYEPFVSVIIPAWNEGVGIVNTVKSLTKSTYRNLEIVVVNDGSTDNSDEKMWEFIKDHVKGPDSDIRIRYRYQQNTGKGGALNHAIRVARGDILISIDADCFVDKNAIGAFVNVFRDPKVMAAVGNVKIGNKGNTVGIVQYLEFLFSFYFKRADALMGTIYIIGGAAGAFRREVFEELGGYNTTNITEDIELTVRIQDRGWKIEYASDALVYTEGAVDLQSLKKQRLRWKRGRFQTLGQHLHLFFSTKKRHNKLLTWIVLPLAMLQELQLLLEIPFLAFLYVYSFVNNDYSSFLTGILVVSTMFLVQFMFYDKSTRTWGFVALAPIGWLLFYVATYVEVWALVKSIEAWIFKREVKWQRWERNGVGNIAEAT